MFKKLDIALRCIGSIADEIKGLKEAKAAQVDFDGVVLSLNKETVEQLRKELILELLNTQKTYLKDANECLKQLRKTYEMAKTK